MKLLPFDIEKAKAGAKIVTRSGQSARIIAYDRRGEEPIVALIGDYDRLVTYLPDGSYAHHGPFKEDLLILSAPTYRTFTRETAPLGKIVVHKNHKDRYLLSAVGNSLIYLGGKLHASFKELLSDFTFEDGSPCGIEE